MRSGLALLVATGACTVVAPMIYVRTPSRRGYPRLSISPSPSITGITRTTRESIAAIATIPVETNATAGIPSTDKCMGCHSQIWLQSPLLEPVRRSYFSGAPIPWNRVHDLPDFVYFNHSIHVSSGVGCVSCHGHVDRMARVYQVATLTMGWCLDCHRNPEPHLRPRAEVASMDWKPPEDAVAYGHKLAVEVRNAQSHSLLRLPSLSKTHHISNSIT